MSEVNGKDRKPHGPRVQRQDVYTTGEIAALCGVSMHTVADWIDDGLLVGFRLPSVGKAGDRRVRRTDLDRFFEAQGWPKIGPAQNRRTFLACPSLPPGLKPIDPDWDTHVLPSLFALGLRVGQQPPTAVLLGTQVGRLEALEALNALRGLTPPPAVFLLVGEDDSPGTWCRAGACWAMRANEVMLDDLAAAILAVGR